MSKDSKNKEIWMEEEDSFNGVVLKFLCRKILFSGQSPYQKVEVVESQGLGRVLLNDRIIMICENDEFVYHDMIAHVPLFVHPNPKKVLIIGGGDGGSAREVLRHPQVELCQNVEIDAMVVEACRKYIPQTACSFSNPKVELIIGDGVEFVKNTKTKYDVILVDSTDPIGPAVPLFGKPFYENVWKALADDGIVVAQGESPFYNFEQQVQLVRIVQSLFPTVLPYHFGNMSYPGGLWSFVLGSKKYHPVEDFQPTRVEKSGLKCKYYNPAIHKAAFASPSFVQKRFKMKQ